MTFPAGARLGPYEIVSPLGAGGMGEVYKARDTRLDRTVAIKVLPAAVSNDSDLRARFEREARAIAALDHPHICAIYDVGEHDGTHYLVMQHLEGETLAARLAGTKGLLPIDQVLKIAIDIADALDKAHRAGITHRDLKPANIMLTKSGAKLLDFGLAKLRGPAGPISMSGMTRLATTPPNTAHGTILGTVHYMAPEQVEGKEADARSDIWALGVVIFEMATGKRPFDGESPASVIGSILKDQPRPISALQPIAPPALDHIVGRCLDRDPDERWQSAADLMRELRWVVTAAPAANAGGVVTGHRTFIAGWVTAVAAIMALMALIPPAWRHWREASTQLVVTRFTVLPPDGASFSAFGASVPGTQFALSPDGRAVVFVAAPPGGRPTLWLRVFDAVESRLVAGTEDASYPFWSPDNRSIGFFADGKLKRVDLAGGPPRALAPVSADGARGGTWNRDGTIVFGANQADGLWQITAGAGRATVAVPLQDGHTSYRWPSFLPDGRHFLFYARNTPDRRGIYVGSLGTTAITRVLDTTSSAVYSPPGYLITARDGALLAYPFDAGELRITGDPIPVAEQVGGTSAQHGNFSVSDNGVLAHSRGLPTLGRLTWFDREGKGQESLLDVGDYPSFRLSRDEKRLAVSMVDAVTYTPDIWLVELSHPLRTRFTVDPASDVFPVWSPDGSRIVFRSDRMGGNNLFEKVTSGGASERSLTLLDVAYPTDWSPDGRYIAFHTSQLASSSLDVFLLPQSGDGKPVPVAATSFTEIGGRFSPDGRLIAYTSNESGRFEVYVQPLPATGARWQVSTGGGAEPQWRKDAPELFYLSADRRLMAAPITSFAPFTAAPPRELFQTHVPSVNNPNRTNYEASADGRRFLVNTEVANPQSYPITVVINWSAGLRK